MAAFNIIVFRLVNILKNRTDFDKELWVIKEITRFKGHDNNMNLKLVQKQ